MAQELIFIRHGQTEWNVAGRLQGRGDSPLTALGQAQARAHLPWLLDLAPGSIVSSPLSRARRTAAILAEGLGLEVELDDRLMERAMGRFEGWTLAEIDAAAPAEASRRLRDPWHYRAPGGENYLDLYARVAPLLRDLKRRPQQRIVVVSHGTLARALLGSLLDLDRDTVLRLRHPNALAYQVVLGEGRSTVRRWQDGQAASGLLLTG